MLETLGEHEAERRGQYLTSVAPASSTVPLPAESKPSNPKAAALCDYAGYSATGLLFDDVQRALQIMLRDNDECSLNELMTVMTEF